MANVKSWTVDDVSRWLEQSGFQKFAEDFREQGVDGEVLLTLTRLVCMWEPSWSKPMQP